jgi:photosystem II stability/assembly factor-like uncharacterized protein
MKTSTRYCASVIALLLSASLSSPAQWTQTSYLSSSRVTALVAKDTILFAGIYGVGFYRSTNNGTTWSGRGGISLYDLINTIVVSGGNVFIGTSEDGVLISTNNGAGWNETNSGLANREVRVLSVSGSNLFAGTHGGGVFLSTNNGTSWNAANNGLTSVNIQAFAVGGTNIFVGTADGGVFRSTNNGTNWTSVNSGLTVTGINALLVSGTRVFAGTSAGVFLSTNNGTTWSAANSGLTSTAVNALCANGTNIFAGTTGGGVFLSTNDGSSWSAVNNGLMTLSIYSVSANGVRVFAGGDDHGVFASSDNGSSWATVDISKGESVNVLGTGGTDLFAGTPFDGAFRSTNNGNTWSRMFWPVDSRVNAITASGQNFIVGTADFGIYLSTNGGTNWTRVVANIGVSAFAFNGTYLFAGTGAGVMLSTDNGASWTNVNNGLTTTYVQALATDGSNVFAGTTGGSVFVTSNNGTTWTSAGIGLTTTTVRALAISGTTLFAGTGDGVFRSTNNGTSWYAASSGLTVTNVTALTVCGTILFAGTQGGGVYVSYDDGTSWSSVNGGLSSLNISALVANSTYLFLGIGSKSAWRRQLLDFISLPIVQTLGAKAITTTGAMLRGTVNPKGVEATYYFEYGLTTGYGTSTQERSEGSANAAIAESTFVSDLMSNMTYHYRIVGKNAKGTVPGADLTLITLPRAPTLVSPTQAATNVSPSPLFKWNTSGGGVTYRLQVSTTEGFGTLVIDDSTLTDTLRNVSGLSSSMQHYWRVNAKNAGGTSAWSIIWGFSTTLTTPSQVQLLQPQNGVSVGRDSIRFVWHKSQPEILSYELMLVGDTTVVFAALDTTLVVKIPASSNEKAYSWRIRAKNLTGFGQFSDIWTFIRITSSVSLAGGIPNDYALYQNFPNPFNPTTIFKYDLPKSSMVRLSVYDIFGREVSILVNETRNAGSYEGKFDASGLASGVYFYRLQAGDFTQTKRLIVLK